MAALNPKETTRRPHKKSRYGCKSCKTRRLKCDETKPACGNCTKSDIACEYLFLTFRKPALPAPAAKKLPLPTTTTVARRNAHFSRPVPRNPISFSFPTSVTSSLSDADRLLEFRLFQHFVNITDVSQIVSGCEVTLWVVRLACCHRSIMDALLGVSAFNLRSSFSSASSSFPTSTIPESKFERDVIRASHHYMGRAIASHRRIVVEEGVTERTGDTVLGSCLFIMCHAVGSQKFLGHAPPSKVSLNKNIDAQDFRVPLHWFVPMKSLYDIMHLAGTYVRDEGMRAQIEWEEASVRVILQNEISPDPENDIPTIFNFLFDDLSLNAPDYEIYALCAKYLNIVGGGKIPRIIIKFPALVPLRFVELLKERGVRVMSIMGYFLMLMKRADIEKKLWWMKGAVENDWLGMKNVFERDELWKGRMEWARREIEGDEVMDFKTGEALARGYQID